MEIIEEILSSKNRVRILKFMIKHETANITAIAKKLDIHHQNAKEHLNVLEKYGIVKKKKYGKILIYEINYGNPFTLAIKRFLEELGEI